MPMHECASTCLKSRGLLAAVALMTLAFAGDANAQTYPSKPIRMLVPGTPGGGMDVIARVIGAKVGSILGQPVVIENKAGANGNLAVDQVAKSAPDGYTILIGQTSHFAINPALYPKLPFDPIKDFAPIVLLADAPNVLTVASQSKYQSLADIVKDAKSGTLIDLATPGNGTVSHLVGEMLQSAAGIKLSHVPYKGASGALMDVMGGRVPMMLSSVPTALGQIRAGKLRPLAVTASKRSPALPNVPTVEGAGYPGFDNGTWYGLLAPAATPEAVIRALNAAANEALKSPDVREKILGEGGDAIGGASDRFAALLKADYAKWGKVVRDTGATID
jgi:tripartite-type tricarboxylate transporter receptor subunit TctC